MNHVAMLTKNNLELTKRCIDSVRAQDIPVKIQVYDNESRDETKEWLAQQEDVIDQSSGVDIGVSEGWNFVLEILFHCAPPRGNHKIGWCAEHVLVIGNDTVLPPFFYSSLLMYPQPFVTGFAVESLKALRAPSEQRTEAHPDFSAFMMRRAFWEKVGPFDESMVLYAQDCDMHVRGHRAGMEMVKVPVPFYHERSSTLRLAPLQEKRQIQEQANKDRATFRAKYGCIPGDPAYSELFK